VPLADPSNLLHAKPSELRMSASLPLSPYKAEFLQVAINGGFLKFGNFELKSKRISPYFLTAGDFYRADLLRAISTAYAKTIIEASADFLPEFDIVFGLAYKGIALATATVDKLAELYPEKYGKLCYTFDRKEAKDHGEGGNFVGAPLRGKKVLVVDDVVTASTAKREAIEKIRKEGGIVVGIIAALDRMEKLPALNGDDSGQMPSAIGEIRKEYKVPVLSVLNLNDIIAGLRGLGSEEEMRRLEDYRAPKMGSIQENPSKPWIRTPCLQSAALSRIAGWSVNSNFSCANQLTSLQQHFPQIR
jgi:orotate phosphoribosyltransferase